MTQTNAFVVVQSGDARESFAGGAWARGIGGEVTLDSRGAVAFTEVLGTFPWQFERSPRITGFQTGLDIGKLNMGGGQTNMYFGLDRRHCASQRS